MNKLSEMLIERIRSHRLLTLFLLMGVLAGVGYWWFNASSVIPDTAVKQEFTKLDVVQYYLHTPDGDTIIGRKNPNFEQFSKVAAKAILGINGAAQQESIRETKEIVDSVKGADSGEQSFESIQEIERKYISVTLWLPETQKISTKIIKNPAGSADKYGNQIITTDRVLLVLSGPYQGMVLTRSESTNGTWTVWDTESSPVRDLVEIVRKGGI